MTQRSLGVFKSAGIWRPDDESRKRPAARHGARYPYVLAHLRLASIPPASDQSVSRRADIIGPRGFSARAF